jgi:hypothetical protein
VFRALEGWSDLDCKKKPPRIDCSKHGGPIVEKFTGSRLLSAAFSQSTSVQARIGNMTKTAALK